MSEVGRQFEEGDYFMPEMLIAAGLRDQVKIIVAVAPVTQDYADQIGADDFAADASRAAGLANSLMDI